MTTGRKKFTTGNWLEKLLSCGDCCPANRLPGNHPQHKLLSVQSASSGPHTQDIRYQVSRPQSPNHHSNVNHQPLELCGTGSYGRMLEALGFTEVGTAILESRCVCLRVRASLFVECVGVCVRASMLVYLPACSVLLLFLRPVFSVEFLHFSSRVQCMPASYLSHPSDRGELKAEIKFLAGSRYVDASTQRVEMTLSFHFLPSLVTVVTTRTAYPMKKSDNKKSKQIARASGAPAQSDSTSRKRGKERESLQWVWQTLLDQVIFA